MWRQSMQMKVDADCPVGMPGSVRLCYVEGRNVTVEYRWLEGYYERLPAILDDVIRRGVAVIAVPGSAPISVGATIPIVFGVAEDPVLLGLVKSLAHPGGNATEINFFAIETDAKRLGLMHELVPKARRVAVLVNPANVRYTEATTRSLQNAAHVIGVDIAFFNASTPAEIDSAFTVIAHDRADALFIAAEAFFAAAMRSLPRWRRATGYPRVFLRASSAEAGLLMSYGTSLTDMARQVGAYTGTILSGAKPAKLPVQAPTKYELVVNLKTVVPPPRCNRRAGLLALPGRPCRPERPGSEPRRTGGLPAGEPASAGHIARRVLVFSRWTWAFLPMRSR